MPSAMKARIAERPPGGCSSPGAARRRCLLVGQLGHGRAPVRLAGGGHGERQVEQGGVDWPARSAVSISCWLS